MIAHHFPPAGGSGSNRALAFARYLPAYGWRPFVLTPGARWAINRDDGLLAEIPAGLRVIRTHSFEPRPRVPPLPLGEAARSAGEGWVRDFNVREDTHPSPQPSPRGRGGLLELDQRDDLVVAQAVAASELGELDQKGYGDDLAFQSLDQLDGRGDGATCG